MKKIKTEDLENEVLVSEPVHIVNSDDKTEIIFDEPVNIIKSEDEAFPLPTQTEIEEAIEFEKEKEQHEKDYQQLPIEVLVDKSKFVEVVPVDIPIVDTYKQYWDTLKQQVIQDLSFYKGQRNINDSRYGTAICERILAEMQAIEKK